GQEILGRHLSVFYLPEDVERGLPAAHLGEATARGQVEDEGRRLRKDRSSFFADVVIAAIRQRGELAGFVVIVREAAEGQGRLQGERLRVTLSSIGDAVIVTNQKGRVTFMNPVAEQLTGWRQEEAEDRPLGEVF